MCYCTPAIRTPFCSSCPSRMLQAIQEKDCEITTLKAEIIVLKYDLAFEKIDKQRWKCKASNTRRLLNRATGVKP
jgi:hypothetical protein